jgi:hypothetical protein
MGCSGSVAVHYGLLQAPPSQMALRQMLLELTLFIGGGVTGVGFPLYRMVHAVWMTAAVVVVVGHLPAIWRTAPDTLRFRHSLYFIVVALALVFLGLATLRR